MLINIVLIDIAQRTAVGDGILPWLDMGTMGAGVKQASNSRNEEFEGDFGSENLHVKTKKSGLRLDSNRAPPTTFLANKALCGGLPYWSRPRGLPYWYNA
jgi:hypothetical protein